MHNAAQIGHLACLCDAFIALNVSGRQLEDVDFVDNVLAQVSAHGINTSHLKLEITESLILDYVKVDTLIARCHQAGIRVALDDFGTGYSNLEHLHKLSFDTLKLDQGFIRQLDDRALSGDSQSHHRHGKRMGCDIVAEAVETPAQFNLLAKLGCQYAQGYLIGRPLPMDEALAAAV